MRRLAYRSLLLLLMLMLGWTLPSVAWSSVAQTAVLRDAGETIVEVPHDGLSYGWTSISVSTDALPDVAGRDTFTMVLERSTDGGGTWETLGSMTAHAQRYAGPLYLAVWHNTAIGDLIPLDGEVRGRVISTGIHQASIRVEKSDPPLPPREFTLHHSVAHDGTANVSSAYHFATSVTLSSKTSAGTDRCAVVYVGEGNAGVTLSGITYGGAATTAVSSATNGDVKAYLHRYVAPATGSTDVVVTLSGSGKGSAGVATFEGVDQTTPIRTNSTDSATGVSTSASVTVDPSAVGDMAVAAVSYASSSAVTLNAGPTSVFILESSLGSESWGGGAYAAGAATVALTWTGANDIWAVAGGSLQAASGGGGGGSSPRTLMLMGVGP